ncbi:hypothetical protein LXA43DRAFT_639474 [Ganoderma leucocontextum]|nr:hypothetical protein LXA43DRAFT_639474 [Ganoderma leucocontextum]
MAAEGASIRDTLPLIYPTHLLSIDDVRKYVARETEKQRLAPSQIVQLYMFQNAFAPANSLPPELLRQIFSYLNFPSGRNANLIRATHVCKQWRAVALADPALWSSFALHSPDGVKECLIRSRDMPLSLALALKPSTTSATYLEGASHRIRSLSIAIPEADGIETLLNKLKAGAPLLEELRVKHPWTYNGGRFRHRSVVLTGPQFVFDDAVQLPSLRSLVLDDVPLPFLPPATLQHLDLTMSVWTPEYLPSLPRLLSLLERCPQLREAKLYGRPESADPPTAGAMVALPNLTQLTLTLYPLRANATLLSHLVLPDQTTLCVRGEVRPPYGESMADMLHLLHPESPSLRWTKDLRRLLLARTPGRWDLQAHRDAEDFTGAPALNLAGWADRTEVMPLDGFVGGWAFNTPNVEVAVLSFSGKPGEAFVHNPITRAEWIAALYALPALKTLRIIGLVSEDVCVLLEALGKKEPAVLCPRLEALEFVNVRSRPWNMWQQLFDAAKVRERREGVEGGLERIEFFDCRVVRSAEEEWEKVFNDIGVDLAIEE